MQKVIALGALCCLCPKLAIYEKDGFCAKPAAMAKCGGTSVSIFTAIIQRPKASN